MRTNTQIHYQSTNRSQEQKHIKQPKMQSVQEQFFVDSLPGFINKLLSRFICPAPNTALLRLGEIETKLYNLSYKGLKRDQFLCMLLAQVKGHILEIQISLTQNNNSLSLHLLKTYCKLELFSWKIADEIEARNKSKNLGQIEDGKEQKNCKNIERFNQLIWRLRVQSQIESAGSSETAFIQILTEFANLDRMPRNFKNRIRQIIIQNDFNPIDKFMRILGEQQHSQNITDDKMKTPHKSHHGTPEKMEQILRTAKTSFIVSSSINQTHRNAKESLNKNQTPNSNNSSNLMIEAHKRIYKNRAAELGRTIRFSNPFKYRVQRKKSTEQNVYYEGGPS